MARTFKDPQEVSWSARLVGQGHTSAYLATKVHRPIVEFHCLDKSVPKKYAVLPKGVEGLDDDELRRMLKVAKTH
jgi:hypothetical protein